MLFLVPRSAEVGEYATKIAPLFYRDWRFSLLTAVVLSCSAYMAYGVVFSSVGEKRRKRRYLLTLNAIHEALIDENQKLKVPAVIDREVGSELEAKRRRGGKPCPGGRQLGHLSVS